VMKRHQHVVSVSKAEESARELLQQFLVRFYYIKDPEYQECLAGCDSLMSLATNQEM